MGQKRHSLGLGLLAVACAAISAVALPIARKSDVAWVEPPRESPGKWHPELIRALSSGQTPAWVDALVLRFVTDPAYAHVRRGEHPAAYYDLDLATDLDPAFFDLYLNGAGILSVVRDDAQGALSLLNKGAQYAERNLAQMPVAFKDRVWNRTWALYFILGYVHLFELHDIVSARDAFAQCVRYSECPSFMVAMVRRLHEPGRLIENAIRIVETRLVSLGETNLRKELIELRTQLFAAMYLRDVNRLWRQERATARSPEALSRFLASRRLSPLDPLGGELRVGADGRIISTSVLSRAASIREE